MATYKQQLGYLHKRLLGIKCEQAAEAAELVAKAIATHPVNPSLNEEIKLFHAVWGLMSRALDLADLTEEAELEAKALEAEMAGHVLTARLAKGELVRTVA